MDISQLILVISVMISFLGIIYMYYLHRRDLLYEIRFYQIAITSLFLAQIFQNIISLNTTPTLNSFDFILIRGIHVANGIGLIFLSLTLYIPQMGLRHRHILTLVTINTIFILSGITNAMTVDIAIINGQKLPELHPMGIFLNILSGFLIILIFWNKIRYLSDLIKEKNRSSTLNRSIVILVLMVIFGLIILYIEFTIGFISIYLVNLIFSIAIIYFIRIVKDHKFDLFLTDATFHGIAVLTLNDLQIVGMGDAMNADSSILNNFISGTLANLYYTLQESIKSEKNLERIRFGNFDLIMMARGDYLFIYAFSTKNVLVDRLIIKYSERMTKYFINLENKELIISQQALKMSRYFN